MGDRENATGAPLLFGVPQLDELLGFKNIEDIHYENWRGSCNSLAIVGPDGTGKSVFALHIASAYHAFLRYAQDRSDTNDQCAPLVFYVSSDLKYDAALRAWQNFYLDYPWQRYVPFISAQDLEFRRKMLKAGQNGSPDVFKVDLRECNLADLAGHLEQMRFQGDARKQAFVSFLDLASHTTGDDWLSIARLAASLPRKQKAPPNLLIVDSVAGFETLAGGRNSFGDDMSRRARVAQLIRTAGDNWHTVLIVEEPAEGTHLPEEYVTDTVLHLRRHEDGQHTRRLFEIEKSRARAFVCGEHPFEIRDGRGTTTRSWENPDDPYTLVHEKFWIDRKGPAGLDNRPPRNAYIQVFPSLQYLSRQFAGRRVLKHSVHATPECISFGVPYLDNMLARDDKLRAGLPSGSITALIGDEGTKKLSLATCLLTEPFKHFAFKLEAAIDLVEKYKASGEADIDKYLEGSALRQFQQTGDEERDMRTERWRQGYSAVKAELTKLAGSRNWHLLAEKDLRGRVKECAPPHCTELPLPRPLMTRWDTLFYYENGKDEGEVGEHNFLLALSLLRMSSRLLPELLLPAVVFVSTDDTSSEGIAEQVLEKQRDRLKSVLKKTGIDEEIGIDALRRLLERFIIVRRIELVDATAPQLWHIIRSAITHALCLSGHSVEEVDDATSPLEYAGSVRVVISDLGLIRQTYPSVAGDPLFLPTVVFRLKRLGITTLVVDSDNGRPDQSPSHPMNRALRSMVDHQIYTWKVPFFGQERIAIAVIPPMAPTMAPGGASVIRELRVDRIGTGSLETVEVDPHFELYMGLEKGKPSAVPLRVVLYAETPAFAEYIDAERSLFSHIFSTVPGGESVIQVETTRNYDGLRDYCHLPIGTKLPFTHVFMVDGYWALGRRNSLRRQDHYLFGSLSGSLGPDEHADVFRLYRETRGQRNVPERLLTKRIEFFVQHRKGPDDRGIPAGGQVFSKEPEPRYYYKSRTTEGYPQVDRVPFTWDFGFLLCSERLWRNAAEVVLPVLSKERKRPIVVRVVWDRLRRLSALGLESGADKTAKFERRPVRDPGDKRQVVTWREFLEASVAVARTEKVQSGQSALPFDLAMAAPDSFACLLFEMWFSEIYRDEPLAKLKHEGHFLFRGGPLPA
jgi:KaiC/GvpD/RAD55 family RecA-like ATPase